MPVFGVFIVDFILFSAKTCLMTVNYYNTDIRTTFLECSMPYRRSEGFYVFLYVHFIIDLNNVTLEIRTEKHQLLTVVHNLTVNINVNLMHGLNLKIVIGYNFS